MGNYRNDALNFDEIVERAASAALYEDQNGGRWQLLLMGDSEAVEQFRERAAFNLTTEAIDGYRIRRPRHIASFPQRDIPRENVSNSEIREIVESLVFEGSIDNSKSPNPIDPSDYLPEDLVGLPQIELEVTLIEPASSPPFGVSFVLDPSMAPAGEIVSSNGTYLLPYWITYFSLGSNDSTAFIGFSARYPVTVYLSSGAGHTSAYGTSDTLTAAGSSNWRIYVQNSVDDFNEFNLWGDLTVY